MSETVPTPEHRDATPEHNHRLATALELEKLLGDAGEVSKRTGAIQFSNEEHAEEASRIFVAKVFDRLGTIDGVSTIDLTLSGPGVLIPNVSINAVQSNDYSGGAALQDTRGAYVSVGKEQPLRALEPLESVRARISSVICTGYKDEEGKTRLKGGFIVDLEKSDRHETMVSIGEAEVPLLVTTVFKRGVVYFGDDTEIEIDVLHDARAEQALRQQLERTSLSKGPFNKYLNRLDTALRTENETRYVEIRDKKIIRMLGFYGAQHSRRGGKYAELASEAILQRFGPRRLLQISYREGMGEHAEEERYAEGRLLNVLMPTYPDDSTVPALVLEDASAGTDLAPISIVPMDGVASIKF